MVVVGGSSQDLNQGPAGVAVTYNPTDCVMGTPKSIGFLFAGGADSGGTDLARDANLVIALYGISKAVPQSTVGTDCMCFGGSCTNAATACSIGGATTPRDTNSICGSGAKFDEMSAFQSLPCD